jgi:Phosphoinositide 3-kinase C2
MAPRIGHHAPALSSDPNQDKWVHVTWMPHTALSQKSYVCLTIRSAHVVFDELAASSSSSSPRNDFDPQRLPILREPPEWRVRVGVYGIAGLPLIPLQLHTTSALVVSKRASGNTATLSSRPRIAVADATHDCVWDYFVTIPIRWRDLPRDAYLHLQVLESTNDRVVHQGIQPFFSQYGRLATGLQKLELGDGSVPLEPDRNHGLCGPSASSYMKQETTVDHRNEADHVWNAVLALDHLEKIEERTRTNPPGTFSNNDTFGQIPSVPWLDALMKERATAIVDESLNTTVGLQLWTSAASAECTTHPSKIPARDTCTMHPLANQTGPELTVR